MAIIPPLPPIIIWRLILTGAQGQDGAGPAEWLATCRPTNADADSQPDATFATGSRSSLGGPCRGSSSLSVPIFGASVSATYRWSTSPGCLAGCVGAPRGESGWKLSAWGFDERPQAQNASRSEILDDGSTTGAESRSQPDIVHVERSTLLGWLGLA
jgi:hypothetical protein